RSINCSTKSLPISVISRRKTARSFSKEPKAQRKSHVWLNRTRARRQREYLDRKSRGCEISPPKQSATSRATRFRRRRCRSLSWKTRQGLRCAGQELTQRSSTIYSRRSGLRKVNSKQHIIKESTRK